MTYYEKAFEPELVPSKLQQQNSESAIPSTNRSSRWSSATQGGTTSAIISVTESVNSSMKEWYTYSVSITFYQNI